MWQPNNPERRSVYFIVQPADEGGFWGYVDKLPGCASQGETLEDCLKNLEEAFIGCAECYLEHGGAIPFHGEGAHVRQWPRKIARDFAVDDKQKVTVYEPGGSDAVAQK